MPGPGTSTIAAAPASRSPSSAEPPAPTARRVGREGPHGNGALQRTTLDARRRPGHGHRGPCVAPRRAGAGARSAHAYRSASCGTAPASAPTSDTRPPTPGRARARTPRPLHRAPTSRRWSAEHPPSRGELDGSASAPTSDTRRPAPARARARSPRPLRRARGRARSAPAHRSPSWAGRTAGPRQPAKGAAQRAGSDNLPPNARLRPSSARPCAAPRHPGAGARGTRAGRASVSRNRSFKSGRTPTPI